MRFLNYKCAFQIIILNEEKKIKEVHLLRVDYFYPFISNGRRVDEKCMIRGVLASRIINTPNLS